MLPYLIASFLCGVVVGAFGLILLMIWVCDTQTVQTKPYQKQPD